MNLPIPQEIIDAERKISRWFASNNVKDWELGDSKSLSLGLAPATLEKLKAWLTEDLKSEDAWHQGYNAARLEVIKILGQDPSVHCSTSRKDLSDLACMKP